MVDRQRYMEILSGQIRCKRAVPLVTKELEAHIEEQKADFLAKGMSESEAEELSVREMGDPVEAGIQMDGIHRPKMNWRLIFVIGLVSAVGLMAWFGLNIRVAGGVNESQGGIYHLFFRYVIYTAAGFLAMVGICYIDYTWLAAKSKKIMLIYSGALLLIPIVNVQPLSDIFSEGYMAAVWLMAFLFLPLCCGVMYGYRGQRISGLLKGTAWMLPVVISLLIYRNRMELLLFLFVLAAVLSYAVGTGTFCIPVKRTLLIIWAVTIILFAGIMKADGFTSFGILPEVYEEFMEQSQDKVQEIIAGSHALGNAGETGGVQGKEFGFAIGVQGEMLEITEVFPMGSEFILTYMAVCFGTFAVAVVSLVVGTLLLRLLALSVKQKNRLGRLMGLGCGLVLFIHAAGYMLVNVGVIMPEQLYCPFVIESRGVIVTYVLLGIMLSIYRYQSISEA